MNKKKHVAKSKVSLRSSLTILGTSIKQHPFAYIAMVFGTLFIIWPRFFIQEIHSYPECIAYDFFPNSNGYPSDVLNSFIYFIQLPLAIAGALIIAFSVRVVNSKILTVTKTLNIAILVLMLAVLLHVAALIAGFDMTSTSCSNYREVFPDFDVIVNSR